MDNTDDFLGKKLFFLYPSAVVQNRIMTELTQQEYEVYTAKDPIMLRPVLKKYPNSLVFGNIQEGMSEKEWENWVNGVMRDPLTKDIGIGMICSGGDETTKNKYLNQLKIKCGWITIKSDLNATMKELHEILKTEDAKGRRKFIRATIDDEENAKVNFAVKENYVNGTVKDISVAGFSCSFDDDGIELHKNTLYQNVQLRLGPVILKIEGIVFGSRKDGTEKVFVILFTQRVDPDSKSKIRTFIQSAQQAKINSLMKYR